MIKASIGFLSVLFLMTGAFAAPSVVTGRIVDNDGIPMTGAAVIVSGTTNIYDTADLDGNFTIKNVPNGSTQLLVQFAGYDDLTLTIKESGDMGTITMKPQSLEAVVVTACAIKLGEKTAEYSEKHKKCIPTACNTPRYVLKHKGAANAVCEDQLAGTCTTKAKHATEFKKQMDGNKVLCAIIACEKDYTPSADAKSCDWVGTCPKGEGVTAVEYSKDLDMCIPTACDTPQYALKNPGKKNATCENLILGECKLKGVAHAASFIKKKIGDEIKCVVATCDSKDFKVSADEMSCEWIGTCPTGDGVKTAEYNKTFDTCIPTECDAPQYELKNPGKKNATCLDKTSDKCKRNDIAHAKTFKKKVVGSDIKCVVVTCDANYTPGEDEESCVWSGTCTPGNGATKVEFNTELDKCIPTACDESRYKLTNEGTASAACVDQVGKACTMENVEHATKFVNEFINGKIECVVEDCEKKWRPSDDKKSCTQVKGECTPTGIAHAVAGEMKNGKCIVYKCADGYKVNTANNTCVEKAEAPKEPEKPKHVATEEEIAELQKNSDAMHAKEQSTANKLIGAAGIGATGIGTMMAASALAEKKADEDAERDMAAYLETFRCDYGRGANIRGGETAIELPGGNDLATMHIEYALLADKLARNKAALNLRPGIEAEVVIDKADTGLYDNGAIGKTGGAYASIARALQNPAGADAAAWNALKEETAKKLKTGAIVAGVGAAGSLVANLVANIKAPKERSREITQYYANISAAAQEVQQEIDQLPSVLNCNEYPGAVSDGKGGCKCTDPNTRFSNSDSEGCIPCPDGQQYNAQDICEPIPSDDPIEEVKTCPLSGDFVDDPTSPDCKCTGMATQQGNVCVCDTTKYKIDAKGECVKKSPVEEIIGNLPVNQPIAEIKMSDKTTFKSGKFDLESGAAVKILNKLATELGKHNLTPDQLAEAELCLYITGYTDHQGFKKLPSPTICPTATKKAVCNQELSQKRAESVAKVFQTKPYDHIKSCAKGEGENTCPPTPIDNQDCRVVTIKLMPGKCNCN